MGKTIARNPCASCGSKDNLITYESDTGLEYTRCVTPNCNGAFYATKENLDKIKLKRDKKVTITDIDYIHKDISNRGLIEETCIKCDIKTGLQAGEVCYSFTYHNLDGTIDIKYKWPNDPETGKKRMSWATPSSPNKDLYLLHLATDYTKPLIITEGEFDAATLVQEGYQAVSVCEGSGSMEKNIHYNLDIINNFPEVWLALDNDEAGKQATEKAKKLLSHKVVKIVDFTLYKDANEAYTTDKDVFRSKLANPVEILPNGIVFGNNLDFNKIKEYKVKSIPLPWPKLNDSMGGLEYGCMYLLLAGTGAGKSTLLRELAYYYRQSIPDLKIANFFFEENEKITPLAYIALDQNIPLGELRRSVEKVKDYNEVCNRLLNTDKLMFINKDFSKESDNLLKNIEYLVTVKGFDLIIIDHISYIIGRSGVSRNGERRDIDEFLYKLQDLVQRLGCIVVAVSHVNESDSNKRWDQGETPNIYSGRGSKALAQIPDGIIGLSRDMANEYSQSILNLYNLKNRWFGKLGKADKLIYIDSTGRMVLE